MEKIVFIPLDERPCNRDWPVTLFSGDDISVVHPKKLGNRKIPANCEELCSFLLEESRDAQAAVISMDMLLYGGLFCSRLHHLSKETVDARFDTIRQIKKNNPEIKIYLFQSIMRCPTECCNDQEPDYYGVYGDKIHLIGKYTHLKQLGNDCDKELCELKEIVKEEHLQDYVSRRKFNVEYNIKTLELLEDNTAQLLIIPQDDSAPFGFTTMDQIVVRNAIAEKRLYSKALMYPGADEVAMTLFSRIINEMAGRIPSVYIRYAGTLSKYCIPRYEDRPLEETLKSHIMAAGFRITEEFSKADIILAVTAPSKDMQEAGEQPMTTIPYCVERNLTELANFIHLCVKEKRAVAILDNAFSNGGEIALVEMLDEYGILTDVVAYAGWNTNANSLGTVLAHSTRWMSRGVDETHYNFLVNRYVEDAVYMGGVRKDVTVNDLPKHKGMYYKDVKETRGVIAQIVHQKIEKLCGCVLSTIAEDITIKDVYMQNCKMHTACVELEFESSKYIKKVINNKS